MFLPGQPVYIASEKKFGIYIGIEPDGKFPRRPNLFVWRFEEDGSDSESYIYEQEDLKPLLQEVDTTLTGSEVYYGPLVKANATPSDNYPEEYWESMVEKMKKEAKKVLKQAWFKNKYEVTKD